MPNIYIKLTLNALLVSFMAFSSLTSAQQTHPDLEEQLIIYHIHFMINNTIEMAAKGSNLIKLGRMEATEGIESNNIDKGRQRLKDAQQLIDEIIDGENMQTLQRRTFSPTHQTMFFATQALANTAKEYIQQLQQLNRPYPPLQPQKTQ